jgi:1-acyl-sn-glycerol-3-phosphate acyltransferase
MARAVTGKRTWAARVLAGAVVPAIQVAAKFEITGEEHLPDSGAYVIAPNHFSNVDPGTVGAAIWKTGRMPHFLAKESLFRVPVFGALMTAANQIPVHREGPRRGADPVSAAARVVEVGGAVVVFPEGSLTRDPDLWPMRGKTGAVRIALAAGIPIIPAAHWGDQEIMAPYSKKIDIFPRKRVQVRFGPAVDLSAYTGRQLNVTELNEATALVMAAITSVLEELRGETAPAERWNPAAHGQSEHGRITPMD